MGEIATVLIIKTSSDYPDADIGLALDVGAYPITAQGLIKVVKELGRQYTDLSTSAGEDISLADFAFYLLQAAAREHAVHQELRRSCN